MTVGVVTIFSYLTVRLLSVILTGRTTVVTRGLDSVVIQKNFVHVTIVQTSSLIRTGGNQEANKCGDMTGNVVMATPYLTTC